MQINSELKGGRFGVEVYFIGKVDCIFNEQEKLIENFAILYHNIHGSRP